MNSPTLSSRNLAEPVPSASGGQGAPSGTPLVRVLHLSDIHCGHPFVGAHVDGALALARAGGWNAIVVSGDFSQRAREREFRQARELLDALRTFAPVLTVPGNHDTAWWHAPFGVGDASRLHTGYRAWINEDIEPVLRVPGLSIVGLNSSWGMLSAALTWYPRDWRVKGGLTDAQLDRAAAQLAESPADDLRLLVVHHNVVRGNLSRRWGMKRPQLMLDRIAALNVDVVCTGHDHEERVEVVERRTGRFVISAANTLSRRMRGRRASALNIIEATATDVTVSAWTFLDGAFIAGPARATMPRSHAGT
ncbi:MAG TPA: metallophosphoesterase [Gemmatimonas aurantiaca]|uniref:Metallophosphoesterase n=1 Tax=Gemmatimonas aurantiaca TaxID=173480 RepID=A0A3D4VCL5_9BACT|nr:metallophosphoesterase [Gemmatimonas aurantiaca]HCT58472.1 metallophosphoesterase [Gemmatimonas aurantiaca]